jgi:gluconolactonase
MAANFAFGDEDLRSLYIAASSSLYRLRVRVAGLRVF